GKTDRVQELASFSQVACPDAFVEFTGKDGVPLVGSGAQIAARAGGGGGGGHGVPI
ncbi:hypothetical protein JHN49_42245, partial [Streptomyces sp. MBT57]|nr:hypothetical protein [Streptomyces sp. MBT57]